MEIEDKAIKKCFKLTQQVFESLNITHARSSSITVLWNKHQIFIYNELKLEECSKILYPDFDISKLVVFSNHLICLDYPGNIHLIPLKFKHSAPKIFKSSFQPRQQNVICVECTEDNIYTLKLVSNKYFINQHKISSDLITENEFELETTITYETCLKKTLFNVYNLNELEFNEVRNYLKVEVTWKQQVLILISFDKLSVYALLYNNHPTKDPLKLVKLHTSPTDICNVNVLKHDPFSVLVSLTIGTVIKIPFKTIHNKEIVHLNSAIHKLIAANNYILYTDGITLWKAEKIFTNDISFKKFFLTNITDFCLIRDQILSTTFNNLVYLFDNNENSYIKLPTQEYFSADIVFNNSDCLKQIIEETEKSAKIASEINKTKVYITTLALSARQDVMDDIIHYNIKVYENFEDILKENLIIYLVDDIKKYYDVHLIYFLIKISTTSLQQKFSEILSNVFGDLKIHITVKSKTDILKTVTVTVDGQLQKTNIAITLNGLCTNKIYINIKLITKISGVFDNEQPLWIILHNKDTVLNFEHFIKTHKPNNNIVTLNNNKVTNEHIVYENSVHLYGHMLKFNKISHENTDIWSYFVNLPDNYEQILKNNTYLKENLNLQKSDAIYKQITEDDFFKGRIELRFDAGHEVKLVIIKDGFSKPLLKISSHNLESASDVKLFFGNLIHCYDKFEPGKVFIDQAVYSSTEILAKAMKKIITQCDKEEIHQVFEQYQKILSDLLI